MSDAMRIPPHDNDAELAVLGALILDANAILRVVPILESSMFYRADHQTLYAAMLKLHDARKPIDYVTLKESLRASGADDIAGNTDLFIALTGQVPSASNAEHYASIVREQWVLREAIAASTETMIAAYDAQEDAESIVSEGQARLSRLAASSQTKSRVTVQAILQSVIGDLVDGRAPSPPIATGFADIDVRMEGGFRPGQFTIIGGRPSTGKSTLAVNLFCHWMRAQVPVMFFSIEVLENEVMANCLSCLSGVPSNKIVNANVDRAELARIRTAAEIIQDARASIHDRQRISPSVLMALAQRQVNEAGCKVVIVDYLQLMVGDDRRGRNWTRLQEVSDISRSLKIMANELGVCVLALSQLNRGSANERRRPRMSDLRECGSLEQDADVIFLLDSDPRPTEREPQIADGRVDLHLEKQRNGPTGVIPLIFDAAASRFSCLDFYSRPPAGAVQLGLGGDDDDGI